MTPGDWNTLTIMGTIAATASGGGIWLTSQFRRIEKTIYREMDKHRREDDARFHDQGVRLQRVELKAFGFTKAP